MCFYPNCKGEPIITLAYADSIRLCERHWEQHCDIELEDDATIAQCIAYERKNLQFHRRCGSEGAAKSLRKLAADRENYVLKSVMIKGERATVAEHRKHIAAKAEAIADAAEVEELFETDDEPADESDDEEEDFFGEF